MKSSVHSIATAIVQARMSSSRLPGKVLLEIAGKPMLWRVVERARRARGVRQAVVATTTDASDDPIQAMCQQWGIFCYRGSAFDVLDRYYQAARLLQARVIVRLTADCPLIDPQIIDHVLDEFTRHQVDFAANRLPPPWKRTYPIGLDTEVCSFQALERAWKEAALPYEREHVMPYLYDQEGRFRVRVVDTQPDYGHLRWTVDTAEDLELVRRVFAHFDGRDDFGYAELIELFEQQPSLAQINADVQHKTLTDVDARMQPIPPRRSVPSSTPAATPASVGSASLTPNPSPEGGGGQSPPPSGEGGRRPGGGGAGRSTKLPLPASVLHFSRALRKNATDAEAFLWRILRNKAFHHAKFRRQHPVGGYILDYYCHEARLAIELDGSGHLETKQYNRDRQREKDLQAAGITILRFWNSDVVNNTEAVLDEIWITLDRLLPDSEDGDGE